jgi:hypothetical protein
LLALDLPIGLVRNDNEYPHSGQAVFYYRGLFGLPFESGGKPERTACPGSIVQANFSLHQLHQPFRDRQPETTATIFSGGGTVSLAESLEQLRLCRGRNPDPSVMNVDLQYDPGG